MTQHLLDENGDKCAVLWVEQELLYCTPLHSPAFEITKAWVRVQSDNILRMLFPQQPYDLLGDTLRGDFGGFDE